MNLTYYVRILIRRGWIIVLAMVITATAAYGFSKMQTPTYRATQRVLFQPARNDYGLTETLRTLLRSYVVYLNSDQQAAEVIDRLQLDMPPGELRSHTTISFRSHSACDPDRCGYGRWPAGGADCDRIRAVAQRIQRREAIAGLQREDRIDAVPIDTAT